MFMNLIAIHEFFYNYDVVVDGPHKDFSDEINHPCRSNPCNDTEVCQITRRKCHHQNSAKCKMYTCKPGK